jgi:hypothetical protein
MILRRKRIIVNLRPLVSPIQTTQAVVIVDSASASYLSLLLQISEAGDLHIQQAELATMA